MGGATGGRPKASARGQRKERRGRRLAHETKSAALFLSFFFCGLRVLRGRNLSAANELCLRFIALQELGEYTSCQNYSRKEEKQSLGKGPGSGVGARCVVVLERNLKAGLPSD